jgi:hypothetical protein
MARKASLALIALSLILGLSAMLVSQGPALEFRLFNRAGFDIYQVFLSPSGALKWGRDLLSDSEDTVIQDGKSAALSANLGREGGPWDLKAVDSDGDSHLWSSIQLRSGGQLVLSSRGGLNSYSWR